MNYANTLPEARFDSCGLLGRGLGICATVVLLSGCGYLERRGEDFLDIWVAGAGMAVELNTSGWSLPCRDAYPSADLLRSCRAREIPVLVNSDAHVPEHVRWGFRRGFARLREVGYEEVVVFEARERRSVPLPRM